MIYLNYKSGGTHIQTASDYSSATAIMLVKNMPISKMQILNYVIDDIDVFTALSNI